VHFNRGQSCGLSDDVYARKRDMEFAMREPTADIARFVEQLHGNRRPAGRSAW